MSRPREQALVAAEYSAPGTDARDLLPATGQAPFQALGVQPHARQALPSSVKERVLAHTHTAGDGESNTHMSDSKSAVETRKGRSRLLQF